MAPNVANRRVCHVTHGQPRSCQCCKNTDSDARGSELRSMASYACFSVSNTTPSRHYAAYAVMVIAVGREPSFVRKLIPITSSERGATRRARPLALAKTRDQAAQRHCLTLLPTGDERPPSRYPHRQRLLPW